MSNMNNAVGLPAVREMLEAGIQVGIGTDGYTANMFEEFRNTLVGLRHRYEDPAGFWTQVQQAQIETNADIVSRCTGCTVGRLEEGAAADFILVDYASPTPLNSENAFGQMFFGMSADLVAPVGQRERCRERTPGPGRGQRGSRTRVAEGRKGCLGGV